MNPPIEKNIHSYFTVLYSMFANSCTLISKDNINVIPQLHKQTIEEHVILKSEDSGWEKMIIYYNNFLQKEHTIVISVQDFPWNELNEYRMIS